MRARSAATYQGWLTKQWSGRPKRQRFARRSPRACLRHEVASFTARDRPSSGDLAGCGAICSRTAGASLVTAGAQARGSTISWEWHTVSSAGNGRYGSGPGSLGLPHRDAGGARATLRPQRQHGREGRSVRVHGKPTHPLTLPVYRGIRPRLVGETRGTWSAGFALCGWQGVSPQSRPRARTGHGGAGQGGGGKPTPRCHGGDRGSRCTPRRKAADCPRV